MTDHRITSVRVTNNTGIELASVGVSHMYSDLYRNEHQWNGVANGATTGPDMLVDYNTGFLTTGRDWWYLVAIDANGQIYQTDPSNARWLWDTVDKGIADIADFATAVAGWSVVAAAPTEGASVPVGIAAAAVKVALSALFNTTATDGYKQFFLETPDQAAPVDLVLSASQLTFKSASGSTATTPLVKAGTLTKPAQSPAQVQRSA